MYNYQITIRITQNKTDDVKHKFDYFTLILFQHLSLMAFTVTTVLCFLLKILITIFPVTTAKQGLILEEFKTCTNGKYSVEFLNPTAKIINNQLIMKGNLSVNVKKPVDALDITVQYKHCNKKTCSNLNSFNLKNICRFLSENSFLGPKLSQFFTPPVTCPLKKVSGWFNVSARDFYYLIFCF